MWAPAPLPSPLQPQFPCVSLCADTHVRRLGRLVGAACPGLRPGGHHMHPTCWHGTPASLNLSLPSAAWALTPERALSRIKLQGKRNWSKTQACSPDRQGPPSSQPGMLSDLRPRAESPSTPAPPSSRRPTLPHCPDQEPEAQEEHTWPQARSAREQGCWLPSLGPPGTRRCPSASASQGGEGTRQGELGSGVGPLEHSHHHEVPAFAALPTVT